MQIITSKDNETVKNIKKLKDKKYRDEAGLYIIEGVKMIEEAIVANAKIDKIVVCEECLKTGDIEQKLLYEIAKYDCIYVNAKVFNFLTDVVAPQGILAVLEKPSKTEKIQYDQDIILALDGIQDPGNLGIVPVDIRRDVRQRYGRPGQYRTYAYGTGMELYFDQHDGSLVERI